MKIITLLGLLALSACTTYPTDQKSDVPSMGYQPIMDWPWRHWRGQDFKPTINPENGVKRQSLNQSQSMFVNAKAMSPNEFIENLKKARIIKRVYNPEFGFFWDRHVSDDVIVELDHNFYTLSHADQTVVADMVSRAYQKRHYSLRDTRTKKVVGQITPQGLDLY